jgi:hypothetical protein
MTTLTKQKLYTLALDQFNILHISLVDIIYSLKKNVFIQRESPCRYKILYFHFQFQDSGM